MAGFLWKISTCILGPGEIYLPMTEKLRSKERLVIGKRIVTFIGPEGSGKTTVAKRLAEATDRPYVTTGDIIRNLAENNQGPLGDECRAMFAASAYLSGESLLKILVHRFSQADVSEGLILDGGLRTVEETVAFQDMLDEAKLNLPMSIIYLQIPYWTSFERLVVGKNARRRKDDTLKGVYGRLSKFHYRLDERIQVIDDQPRWNLITVNANRPVEEVVESVFRALIKF